jgi:hypothetical protein
MHQPRSSPRPDAAILLPIGELDLYLGTGQAADLEQQVDQFLVSVRAM